jgi:hypothetical protein
MPQDLKDKMLKQSMNHWMIGLALKPWDVYDSWKKRCPNNWIKNQNTILYNNFLIFSSWDVLIWIKAKVEQRFCFLKTPKKIQNFLIFENPNNPNI